MATSPEGPKLVYPEWSRQEDLS